MNIKNDIVRRTTIRFVFIFPIKKEVNGIAPLPNGRGAYTVVFNPDRSGSARHRRPRWNPASH
jgi:hypothetical protein